MFPSMQWRVELLFFNFQVPVVGMSPLKSLEQLGPLGVLVAFQLLEFIEIQRRKHKMNTAQVMILRLQVLLPPCVKKRSSNSCFKIVKFHLCSIVRLLCGGVCDSEPSVLFLCRS